MIRLAVTLDANDCSAVAFSSFEAHSSSLVADVLALEALPEGILKPPSPSTFFSDCLTSSAAPTGEQFILKHFTTRMYAKYHYLLRLLELDMTDSALIRPKRKVGTI